MLMIIDEQLLDLLRTPSKILKHGYSSRRHESNCQKQIHKICISVELEAMEEHLKALEGVVARLETLTGAKQDVSPSKVMMVMSVIINGSGGEGGVRW